MTEEYLIIGRYPLGKDDGKEHVLETVDSEQEANALALGFSSQGYSTRIAKVLKMEGDK